MYCTKYTAPASRPSLPQRPTSKQATQYDRQNENYQTDPISPNRSQISILQRSPDPAPSRVTEVPGRGIASGFRSVGLEETRGFSRTSRP